MNTAKQITISQIEIYKSPIQLKEPFVISLGPLEFAPNVVIVIRTNQGLTGFGECSPFMSINGESMETCFVVAHYLANALKGRNPSDIADCSLVMDRVIYGNSSIKSAFDIALYDIASQHAGMPLYAFLGGHQNKIITTDYTVSFGDPVKMAQDALSIKERRFQIIKVKLGESKDKDVERIRMIRETIGMILSLRIDANQGWDVDEAIETLIALAPYNIQLCEEPIPRWNFMELSNVRKHSPIRIMADESCCDHHDAKRLIDLSACDFFNIKLGKSGGIFNALKMIQLAEQAKIDIQIGGFLESRLGFTASAHLALTSYRIVHYDFDTPLMFVEDPVLGGITYDDKGVVNVPDMPGLGAAMSESYLQQLEKAVIH
jgi:L-alanine-DL-glutamate epimerase-like enolase superfamily enzyme